MGMYEQYLKELLLPLGVYDLTETSVSGSDLHAAGAGLDMVCEELERVEREALTATAEGEGLSRREELFAQKPAASTAEQRRLAIAALLQIDEDSLTPGDIDRAIRGCGIRAKALEADAGSLRVVFPEVAGVPEEFEQIKRIILDILPCHLEVEFYFRYLTWEECERAEMTWAVLETAEHTWETLELAVPPAE